MNYYVDIGTGNKPTNVSPDPNSQTITFVTQNQTKDIMIDGKHYTFVNTNHDGTSPASNKVSYSYNPNTGELLVIGSDITLICADDKENNIKLMGNNNIIQGGNQNDTITVDSGSNNYIYGNAGNDTIEVNASNGTNEIDTGEGNDTLTINSDNNTNIQTGSGNDKLNIRGDANTADTGSGDDTVLIIGKENNVQSSEGNNTFNISGDKNIITGGIGNEKITISGSENTINTDAGNDVIKIYGDSNKLETTGGENEIDIEGNTNEITGGTGKDKITIEGDSNIACGGDANDEFIIKGGDSNNIDGNAGETNILYDRGTNTKYKNVILMSYVPTEIRLQIGANSKDSITISLGVDLSLFNLDFTTIEDAAANIDKIDELLNEIYAQQAQIGAVMNRLESVSMAQTTQIENLTASRSTIIDADIAAESAAYVKNQILQQTSTSLLSSTQNLRRSLILNLLQ